MSNVVKEISEICPFQDGDEFLINDTKLPRYLFLSLPLMHRVVDNLINSLMYKFQGNLFFLYNFYSDCLLILRQKEYDAEDIYKLATKSIQNARLSTDPDAAESINGEEKFNDYVKKSICVEVRLNLLRLKRCVFSYFLKIVRILEFVILYSN